MGDLESSNLNNKKKTLAESLKDSTDNFITAKNYFSKFFNHIVETYDYCKKGKAL